MGMWVRSVLALVVIAAAAFLSWVFTSTYQPAAVQDEPVVNPSGLAPLQAGQSLSVLSWNVQFFAGNKDNHFFYDGGTDPWPSRDTVERVGRDIAAFIKAQKPDIVLLQEMDEGADRTYRMDQTAMLLDLLPEYRAHTSTFYWKAQYVPHPGVAGKVGLKLVVLSRYPIDSAIRYALPAITTDDFITRQFNLKRAFLELSLPIAGGGELKVINTHLSAFAQGSDTMARQVDMIDQHLRALDAAGTPWLIAGDFNLLPDAAAYERLPAPHRESYNASGTELAPLLKYPMVPSLESMSTEDVAKWYTYAPSSDPQCRPDRTIDYLFYSPALTLERSEVVHGDALPLSDHMPVMATLKLP